jgi:hypothetical protein
LHKTRLILSLAKIAYRLQERKTRKTTEKALALASAEKNEKLIPGITQQIEHYKHAGK